MKDDLQSHFGAWQLQDGLLFPVANGESTEQRLKEAPEIMPGGCQD